MIQLNWYQIFGQSIPDGRTVTPTDDIQIWLHCGNIWDKNYTTLAQVLADTDTLVALMASDNAVDYLVRSTSFIYGVGTVPVMTSATTPSGTVGGSLTSTGHEAYKAFDGDDTTYALRTGASRSGVDYTYNQAENIKAMYVFNASSVSLNFTIYYKETAESANATASSTIAIPSNSGKYIHTTSDNISGVLWGAFAATGSGTADLKVSTVQFYNAGIVMSEIAMKSIGASDYASNTLLADSTWNNAIQNSTYFEYVDNAKVPTMTSNTTPSGESFSGSALSVYLAYKAFDNDASTEWVSNYTSALSTHQTDTIGYKFDNAVSIQKLYFHDYNPNYDFNMTYIFSGSNDGVTYTDLYTENTAKSVRNGLTQIINNSENYTYYRLTVTMWASSSNTGNHPRFDTLQFYGRQPGGVQTWLHAAGITDKSYTTLAQVLVDSDTLSALMSNQSAVNYLVTAKGWADDICADSNAMTYIGLNNYCANTLLADATWRTAICNSTYFESVLNVKIPVMSSNNTPSGKCTASYQASSGTKAAWYAFDNNSSTEWGTYMQNVADAWVGYEFAEACTAYKYSIYLSDVVDQDYVVLKASSDGSNFVDIIENIAVTNTTYFTGLVTKNFTLGKYIRMRTWASIAGYGKYCRELQIWGRKDV